MNQTKIVQLKRPKPLVLLIIDGFGVAPLKEGNLFYEAKAPYLKKLIASYPATTLWAHGEHVGLLPQEGGNCLFGHLTMGSGRVISQNLIKINKAIEDRSFFSNPILLNLSEHLNKHNSSLHLVGLLSDQSAHSSINHLYALLEFIESRKIGKVFLHLFLDGIDADKEAGLNLLKDLKVKIAKMAHVSIATISGRYFAMDRDKNWSRIEKSFLAINQGEGEQVGSVEVVAEIEKKYKNKIYDDHILPIIFHHFKGVKDGDGLLFFNFRADYLKELTSVFARKDFAEFPANKKNSLFVATLTDYGKEIKSEIVFPYAAIKKYLADVLDENGLKQLYITETEKYSYLTYFFNGRSEEEKPTRKMVLVPSEAGLHHFENPNLKAMEIAKNVEEDILKGESDFLAVNLVNADVIGNTGDIKATKKAIEIIDKAVKIITNAVLAKGGVLILTSDHGNVEEMAFKKDDKSKIKHSSNPVPFILVNGKLEGKVGALSNIPANDLSLAIPKGGLADVAPTILKILGIKQPKEMTGKSLI